MGNFKFIDSQHPLRDGVPCGHIGCLSHISHPCEGCGRVAGRYTYEFIYWLFKYRCVTCRKPATEINHIIPKGRGEEYRDDFRNKVPQCSKCHEEYHQDGVTATKIRHLQETRRLFLSSLGREKFI